MTHWKRWKKKLIENFPIPGNDTTPSSSQARVLCRTSSSRPRSASTGTTPSPRAPASTPQELLTGSASYPPSRKELQPSRAPSRPSKTSTLSTSIPEWSSHFPSSSSTQCTGASISSRVRSGCHGQRRSLIHGGCMPGYASPLCPVCPPS